MMRHLKLIVPAALLLVFSSQVFAQLGALPRPSDIVRDSPGGATHQNEPLRAIQRIHNHDFFGFNGGVSTFGTNAQIGKNWAILDGVHTQFSLQLLSVNNDNPYSRLYNNSFRDPKGNVMLVPLYFGMRRDIFFETFQNAILPYVEAGAGPVFGMHFPYGHGFFGAFQHMGFQAGGGGYLGGGFDYDMGQKTVGNIGVRYNYIRFPNQIGDRLGYSGVSITFGIHRMKGR